MFMPAPTPPARRAAQLCPLARSAHGRAARGGRGGAANPPHPAPRRRGRPPSTAAHTHNPPPALRQTSPRPPAIYPQTLAKLHHRNIVQFYGACLEVGSMFFVTELMKVRECVCVGGGRWA